MALSTGQITVGLTPTLIDGTSTSNFKLWILNADSTQKVYIGDENVTITTGMGIEKLQTMYIEMYPLDTLYAISDKTGHIITWMKQV